MNNPTRKRFTCHAVTAIAAASALVACGGGQDGGEDAGASAAPSTRLLATTASANAPRVMERLGRGVVALRASSNSVFVSWRLLGLDPAGIGFNVYRAAGTGSPVKLNASVLTAGTNYTDTTANLAVDNTYTVRPVIGDVEQAASGGFKLTANHATEPIVRVPLAALPGTGYRTKYVWVGDLDGDGEYDFVVDRIAPFEPDSDGDLGTGHQYIEAYKRDGTRLWQINLGPNSLDTYNISPGASTVSMGMYDGVTVYDLNGDGKAEVILKVANGVVYGNGAVHSETDNEKQSIAVINGMTGAKLASSPFPQDYAARGSLGTQLGIGYADGINPSIYLWGRNRNADKSFNDVFAAWSWNGGSTLTSNWVLPLGSAGPKEASHQMRIIDVDADGKDELATGNFVINSNGTLRYVLPGVKHGDRFFIGKFDATSSGMQGYGIQQDNPSGLLEYYYNATNGTIQWQHFKASGTADVGRGLVGDVDARYPGFEVWSFSGLYNGPSNTLAEPDTSKSPYPTHSIWWDGDVLTEGLNDYKIEKWNPLDPRESGSLSRLLTMSSSAYGSPNIFDHNPLFFGDIFGDWRTEIVLINDANTELVIFSTTTPSTTRLYTMAHNPAYRNSMTLKGYMQSHLPDYYLGSGMGTPVEPNIRYAGGGTIQAESAVLAGGASALSDRPNYHGTGFVDFPGTGGSAEFRYINGGSGGAKTISIRHANGAGTARAGVLKVNGTSQAISFPSTGGWTNWATLNVTVTLAAGSNNTLRFESNGQDLANIDEITVP